MFRTFGNIEISHLEKISVRIFYWSRQIRKKQILFVKKKFGNIHLFYSVERATVLNRPLSILFPAKFPWP